MSQPTPAPLLSPVQRKITSFAITFAAGAAIVILLCVSVIVLGRLLSHFSGVLWPLVAAGILALILRPVVDWLERRMKLKRLSSVLILYVLFALAVAGVLLTIIPPLVGQLIDLFTYLPTFWNDATKYLDVHYPAWLATARKYMENPAIRSALDSASAEIKVLAAQTLPSLKAAGVGMVAVFTFLTQLAIVPVYLFFFLMSRTEPADRLAEHLPFLSRDLREDVVFLAREFVQIVVTFFRGQLIIGLAMGVLLAIGFSVIGLKFGLLLGLLCGLLNVVPYLGTVFGIVTTLPIAFFQPEGGWQLVGLVILVKVIVQNIEG